MKEKHFSHHFHFLILLAGDTLVFIGSLALALFLRHRFQLTTEIWDIHRTPYFFIFLMWLFLLIVADFYHPRRFHIRLGSLQTYLLMFVLWDILSFGYFYFFPIQGFAPKILLLLHTGILILLLIGWRIIAERLLSGETIHFAVFGFHPHVESLFQELAHQGKRKLYECHAIFTDHPETIPAAYTSHLAVLPLDHLTHETLLSKDISLVITAEETIHQNWADFFFRELFPSKIKVERFSHFFEVVAQKIPVQTLAPSWFLENFDESDRSYYENMKRLFDVTGVALLAIPSAFVSLIIMLFLAVEGKTKIFFSQTRLKKGGGTFRMYKFASMMPDAEQAGPQWSKKGDHRVTKVGRIIRYLHLDEMPQLINILQGDMSFVGPRPERPEFVEELHKKNPFYYQRFLVTPGLTGWAQLNYPYGETADDAIHKLQYELYYIKHRSLLMDLEILLRSVRVILVPPKR